MQNFVEDIFSWIGFTVVIILILYYFFHDKLPSITFNIVEPDKTNPSDKTKTTEKFAVDLNTYSAELPTVYSKNCAFDGIKPKGYIPNIPNWQMYSDYLP